MKQGFTLIELMIVVAIIAFLAVLAVPHLFHYKAKAYQAEVAMNLASLHTAQQAYFAQNGKYTAVLSGENGIGWQPAGYKAGSSEQAFTYTYGFNTPGAQEGVHYFTGKLKAPKDSLSGTAISDQTFTAGAAADIAGKGKADVWQINELRDLQHSKNGLD